MALDMMLKTLIISPEFNEMPDKNWVQIARNIPGTTPRQCQRRYEELLKESTSSMNSGYVAGKLRPGQIPSPSPVVSTRASKSEPEANESARSASRPGSAKTLKSSKSEKDASVGKVSGICSSAGDQGRAVLKMYHATQNLQQFYTKHKKVDKNYSPVMVIHVCDEAKKLKQDFQCPRDLLIREMKYFAEYLSTDAQRWEEVDISVHCDVLIFEWLMKYVKRNVSSKEAVANLEPTNVISILISSDFLKMESLVEECIAYCQRHLSAIVATPCNMNCIHDGLVTRIAARFDHNTADQVKDRKDKFKSKLFAKKLERLFDTSGAPYPCSPENATTLYRCAVCKKLLTKALETRLKCAQCKLMIERCGRLGYQHVRDPAWDCNDYLLELKQQLKTWRDVYWRLWGTVNWLNCARCGEVFQCTELGHCQYHPDPPVYDDGPIGEYPCCKLKVLRFDPAQPNKGCKVRDHIVEVSKEMAGSDAKLQEKQKVYEDLLVHRDAVCVPFHKSPPTTDEEQEINIFSQDEQQCGLLADVLTPAASESSMAIDDPTSKDWKPRLQPLTTTLLREMSYADDDFALESDDDEFGGGEEEGGGGGGSRVGGRRGRRVTTVDPQAILLDAPDFGTTSTRRWDSSRSLRWNQDAQREEDQRRMNEIIMYLTKLRCNPEKMDKLRQKEYNGGIFSKLEAQWKATAVGTGKTTAQFRNKPRLGTISK